VKYAGADRLHAAPASPAEVQVQVDPSILAPVMTENWAWGLALIALTMTIHAVCVAFMAIAELSIRARLERRRLRIWHDAAILIGAIVTIGILLAVLHGIEAAIWAAAYLWLGALDSPVDAILYSLDSITTRGASGLVLQQHWRRLGALEAADGMLLFGISTALIVAVMQSGLTKLYGVAQARQVARPPGSDWSHAAGETSQAAVQPPSTDKAAPVVEAPMSEAR
jgi:hypothetical protein